MDNILVTGGTGFLGSIIINSLKLDYNVLSLSRKSNDYKYDLSNQIPHFNLKFDIVIHAAGKAHDTFNFDNDTNIFHNNNVIGTINLLNGLYNSCIPNKFVYISSVSVYGLQQGVLINEESPLISIDKYSESKICAEQLILNWCIKNNVICTILRLPLIVGENPPGNLGNMIKSIKKRHFFLIKNNNSQKSMVLAKDVANYIPIISKIGGIYNLTDGMHPAFNDLVYTILKNYSIKFIPRVPLFLAKIIAFLGDLFKEVIPLNSKNLKKITQTLTFDDSKARLTKWKSTSVINWISNNKI